MDLPGIACIITTFRRPERVRAALESVVRQDYRPLEIIVVDDNPPKSDDAKETRELVEPLLADYRGRWLSTGGEKGAPTARNLGVRETEAPFVAFLDDDDLWRPEKLAKQLQGLLASGWETAYSYCNLAYVDDHQRILNRKRVPPGGNPLRTHLLQVLAPTSCLLIRRWAFEEVGGFIDIQAGQDFEIQLRLLKRYGVCWIDDELVDFRVHPGARISSGSGKIDAAIRLADIKRRYYSFLSTGDQRNVEAASLASIGKHMVRGGRRREGRYSLFNGLLLGPFHLRWWVWWLLSFFGRWAS